jgi:response regulator RpfG family c-di-GMP phosphodiesterase
VSEIPLSADAVQGSLLLIVDDVPTNLNVLGDLLRDAGYRIKAATSGPVALRYAAMEPRPALDPARRDDAGDERLRGADAG